MRVAYTTIQDGGASQQIEYDMTLRSGFCFNIRLISEDEKPRWKDHMKETCQADDGDVPFIGAQRDARKATHQPPDAFDESVKVPVGRFRTFQ